MPYQLVVATRWTDNIFPLWAESLRKGIDLDNLHKYFKLYYIQIEMHLYITYSKKIINILTY